MTLAGVVGSAVAVFHGILMQRMMIRPIERALAGTPTSAGIRRLVSPLLHLSTIAWLAGGLALIAVGSGWAPPFRLPVALVVGAFYFHAMVLNCWATRGRHPGWMLMAAALLLILIGA
ncbi:hypothetical protein [Sphingopyxis sp.]|uniref:hypothetical protein n=1 Tax=Sphingopyxis sp. TaxID=1908224 RepID=UPI002FCB0653